MTVRATAGNPFDPDDDVGGPEPEPVEPAGETGSETDAETETDEQPQQSS